MIKNPNIQTFFALVRAGLWGNGNPNIRIDGTTDWQKVYQLAHEQSVVGLVAAGIDWFKIHDSSTSEAAKPITGFTIPQEWAFQFIGATMQIEQQNKAMNLFVADLIEKLREHDIYALLVKGQGIAQCYERPLWRTSGDVDLFLNGDNYNKAKKYIYPLSSGNKSERLYSKEWGLKIGSWYVELHGTQRTGLSTRVDSVIDEVQRDVFYSGNVRSAEFKNSQGISVQVFLPAPSEDVFLVFVHFVKHFYKEGMNLRQICDWCRLIWTFCPELDLRVLETRIRKAGLMGEWRAFAALAVDYLGMPVEAMPLYNENDNENKNLHKKAERLLNHILKGGPYSKVRDTWAIFKIFPWNMIKFLPSIFLNINGLKIRERMFG